MHSIENKIYISVINTNISTNIFNLEISESKRYFRTTAILKKKKWYSMQRKHLLAVPKYSSGCLLKYACNR